MCSQISPRRGEHGPFVSQLSSTPLGQDRTPVLRQPRGPGSRRGLPHLSMRVPSGDLRGRQQGWTSVHKPIRVMFGRLLVPEVWSWRGGSSSSRQKRLCPSGTETSSCMSEPLALTARADVHQGSRSHPRYSAEGAGGRRMCPG